MMKACLLLLLTALATTNAYHILCVFPVPSHSHNQLGKGFVDALIKKGHEVTWITPYPEKAGKNLPKTLHILDVSEVLQFLEGTDMTTTKSVIRGLAYVKEFSNNVTRTAITNPAVNDVLINTQFDAVVTESFFSDVMAGLPAVLQAPWILLSGTQLTPMLESQIDEVRSISTVPLMFNPAGTPMNFKERAFNAAIFSFMTLFGWWDRPKVTALYEQIFSPLATARNVPLPSFDAAFNNISILFTNSHESLSPAFSTPPNVVNIAGYHIDENPAPLTKDLKELLDNSKQGVIYFSMGSVVRSSSFKPHTRKALLAVFAKLPYTVLWKFEKDMEEPLPPNVHIRQWMPQLSILAHPNVKLFIIHGGQLSSLEAVHTGVPLLAVPVFGDQPANADRAVSSGYALKVPFSDDMADEIEEKLGLMLANSSYTERVKYLSKLFRARPLTPSQMLTHYIELAIETKGAYHLRSLSLRYSWIERWMLDLVAAAAAALLLLAVILKLIIKTCFRKLFGSSKNVQVKNKKDSKKKKN